MSYLYRLFLMLCMTIGIALALGVSAGAGAQTLDPNTIDPLTDIRYCGAPKRDANGVIIRNPAVPVAYQHIHPCPSTGLQKGACPNWARNHAIPMACGGCDAVWNMVWVPTVIKACAGKQCIDRHEREINASDPPQPDTAACVNKFPVVLP